MVYRTRRRMKRALDVAVAGSLLVVLSPVLAAVSLAILVTMGTPILFRDQRAGFAGRPIELLKFRTMRPLRPGETIPENDGDRITRVGRLLRSTSLDELPTLVNVVRGDLSLVGPRPLPLRYVRRYDARQVRRLDVRPGITGLAQVSGRNALSWPERFDLDVRYVGEWSLRLDARILAGTVAQVAARNGISHGEHATMPEFLGTGEAPRPAAHDATTHDAIAHDATAHDATPDEATPELVGSTRR
jgi:lipopolysaccharide/colanic/teichoic acid biosynthesis glycosyltransferase